MTETIEFNIPSNPKYLQLLRKFTKGLAELIGFTEIDSEKISLAIDEACTNIIKHNYDNDFNQKIIIDIYFDEQKLEIHLKDFGKELDLSEIKVKHARSLKPGGLGVSLIVGIMDIVEYDRSSENYNVVKLTKFLKSSEGENR